MVPPPQVKISANDAKTFRQEVERFVDSTNDVDCACMGNFPLPPVPLSPFPFFLSLFSFFFFFFFLAVPA